MSYHFAHDKTWEEHTKYYKVEVYPAKDPTHKHAFKNDKGETYDLYWIVDSFKTWRIKPNGWKRIIKRYGKRIDHLKNLDQYDRDVLDYIKKNYPLS